MLSYDFLKNTSFLRWLLLILIQACPCTCQGKLFKTSYTSVRSFHLRCFGKCCSYGYINLAKLRPDWSLPQVVPHSLIKQPPSQVFFRNFCKILKPVNISLFKVSSRHTRKAWNLLKANNKNRNNVNGALLLSLLLILNIFHTLV